MTPNYSNDPARYSPFVAWAGIEFTEVGQGKAKAKIAIRPEMLNSVGVTHGGIYTSLADTCAGGALATLKAPEEFFVTTDFHCAYFKATTEGDLVAEAEVIHRGKSIANVDVRVLHEGNLVSRASVTFAIRVRR